MRDIMVRGAEGEIPARVYTPEGNSLGDPRPILLWFHGGGMVIGDNYVQSDRPARRIANRTHCIVLAVEYGLAPEHPFPAGVQDCCASLRWAAEHGGEIGGDPVAAGGPRRQRRRTARRGVGGDGTRQRHRAGASVAGVSESRRARCAKIPGGPMSATD